MHEEFVERVRMFVADKVAMMFGPGPVPMDSDAHAENYGVRGNEEE